MAKSRPQRLRTAFCVVRRSDQNWCVARKPQLQPQPQLSPQTLDASDWSVPFLHIQYTSAARSGQPHPLNALEENTLPHVPRMSRMMRIQRQLLPPKQLFIVFPPISFSARLLRVTAAEYVFFVFCGLYYIVCSFLRFCAVKMGDHAVFLQIFFPTRGPFGCQTKRSLL